MIVQCQGLRLESCTCNSEWVQQVLSILCVTITKRRRLGFEREWGLGRQEKFEEGKEMI